MPSPTHSLVEPVLHVSGTDYTYLCTKPRAETDKEDTVKNYEPETFAQREILLNALAEKFRLIDHGLFTFIVMLIEHGSDPAIAVQKGLALLKQAHGRSSHVEAVFLARLKIVLEAIDTQWTLLLMDVLMCPSGPLYYCDPSPTMNVLRPYLTGIRKGTSLVFYLTLRAGRRLHNCRYCCCQAVAVLLETSSQR